VKCRTQADLPSLKLSLTLVVDVYSAIALLGFIYVFYTVPLAFASQLADPDMLERIFPGVSALEEAYGFQITQFLAGLITAGIWSSFFALCPIIFKSIAFFGSKATSVAHAEHSALQYYWWFMVLTAFSGQLLATMGIKLATGSNSDGDEDISFENEFQRILREIAGTIPSRISVAWLNWIVFRCTITLPVNYLLQINSFILAAIGFKCCSRLVRGVYADVNVLVCRVHHC
jgi:Calcium-dependent channel, 7TM region, putative phosphate